MKEELKTLNDINEVIISIENKDKPTTAYSEGLTKGHANGREFTIEQLRNEAIKWIKYHTSINNELEPKGLARYPHELNDWIMHFFNITEADLK